MSKRGPTSELNHDNWDQEEEDKEVAGEFKQASTDVIHTRKILQAKRKSMPSADGAVKTPFGGFTAFGGSSSTPNKPNFNFIVSSKSAETPKTNGQEKKSDNAEALLSSKEYYHQLKSLNVSVSAWIAKHVQSNPYCIMTPVFRDYERHLANIEKKKPLITSDGENTDSSTPMEQNSEKESSSQEKITETKDETPKSEESTSPEVGVTAAADSEKAEIDKSCEEDSAEKDAPKGETAPVQHLQPPHNPFLALSAPRQLFPSSAKPSTTTASATSFVFGNTATTATSLFGSNPSPFGSSTPSGATFGFGSIANKPSGQPTSAGFSFGNSGFSFGALAKKTEAAEGENAEEGGDESEEPPKVEFNTFKEDDAVYEIKCKVFVLKDKEYKERGLGQLFIKKKDPDSKAQLLIRSAGATGQILINVLLTSSLAPKRVGKNNVQMPCVPTPDCTEPSIVMIRVKGGEDADELLAKIEEYKK
ncbi:LOW QUALITY PROTEIN: nuclear pore complex protein Nup50 [Neocloeon triangulifer]|uniref:LOW QUALITY PROTEIN: nuclear pore complex protein Nup50 n=1 Tax=Neocloeon triangulifer TaxID=2078957 RepID=UPI00286EBD52|nr:LOW QUALITY PROTEIN: nuclear pore complex protein Nup50 [Neocloeon triangulifer]